MLARSTAGGTSQPTPPQQNSQQTSSSGDSPTIQQLRPLVKEANATTAYNARLKGGR